MSRGLLGVVLAGGGSRRYGTPKETAVLGGEPLLTRALRAVAPVAAAVGIVGEPSGAPTAVPVKADLRPGLGPLGGIETALEWARQRDHQGVVVLACDLPVVNGAALAYLVEVWRGTPDPEAGAAMAGTGAGRQPLCGVYGVGLASSLAEHLAAGEARSVWSWVDRLGGRLEVPVPELASRAGVGAEALLLNVNRPEDRLRAELLLAPAPPIVSVIGWKGAGKTTVAVELTSALRARGLRVVALKHGHGFRLDTPGTDSWRLWNEGGASRLVLAGPEGGAVLGEWGPGGEPSLRDLVRRYASDADLVIAEGWKQEAVPAIEVRAAGASEPALFHPDGPRSDRFVAVVGDPSEGEGPPPHLHRDAPDLGARLAALVLGRLLPDRVGKSP